MELVKIEVEGTKEVHEVALAFKKLAVSYKLAAKDGFQAATDIPAVLMGSIQDLMAAFEGMDKLGVEVKLAPFKAAMGAMVPVMETMELLMKKEEKDQAPSVETKA